MLYFLILLLNGDATAWLSLLAVVVFIVVVGWAIMSSYTSLPSETDQD